jgi:hypothetical protein
MKNISIQRGQEGPHGSLDWITGRAVSSPGQKEWKINRLVPASHVGEGAHESRICLVTKKYSSNKLNLKLTLSSGR